jgi:hypothetical protein
MAFFHARANVNEIIKTINEHCSWGTLQLEDGRFSKYGNFTELGVKKIYFDDKKRMRFELMNGVKVSANKMLTARLGRALQPCSVIYFRNGRGEIKSLDKYCPA